MSNREPRHPPSLTLNLTVRWIARLIWLFLEINVFLCLLGVAGFVIYAEHEIAEAYALGAVYEDFEHPSVTVTESDGAISGYYPPGDLLNMLPPEYAEGARYFYIDDMSHMDAVERLHSFEYRRALYTRGGLVTYAMPAAAFVDVLGGMLLSLCCFQVLLLAASIGAGNRIARRVLRPLYDMAQAANVLHEREPSPSDIAALSAIAGAIDEIDADRIGTRLPVDNTQSELRDLASAINEMLARLDAAYRSQARFVSDASHELKTPIAVIQGYANLLDRWGKSDEHTLQESIDAIKDESERMKILVNDLLFLARGDNDSVVLKYERHDLTAMIDEICRECRMVDESHSWECEAAPGIIYECDPVLIRQAVRVLTENAIKYTDAGGKIKLCLKRRGAELRISVQDEGIGIPSGDIPKIFDRFFRSDPSRNRKTGGAGLGLSIARWIVEKHEGHFEVLSREGIGTRITICLPAKGAEENGAA